MLCISMVLSPFGSSIISRVGIPRSTAAKQHCNTATLQHSNTPKQPHHAVQFHGSATLWEQHYFARGNPPKHPCQATERPNRSDNLNEPIETTRGKHKICTATACHLLCARALPPPSRATIKMSQSKGNGGQGCPLLFSSVRRDSDAYLRCRTPLTSCMDGWASCS